MPVERGAGRRPARPVSGRAGVFHGLATMAEAFAIACFVALGGIVGSFLNVVAHRVPRGESFVFEASHCPACHAKIRPWDNVPVLGWLVLGGRCRDCKAPIAARYPLVEAVCAALVGLTAAVELLTGGRNLPESSPVVSAGARWGIDVLLLHPDWRLFGICLLHCGLLVTLLAWALLDRDGQRVPGPWVRTAVALVIGAVMLWPTLLPIGLLPSVRPLAGPGGWPEAAAMAVAGPAAGWLLGRGIANSVARDGLCLIGAAMGWRAAVLTAIALPIVAGACGLLGAAWRAASGNASSATGSSRRCQGDALVVATAVQILAWRWIERAMAAAWAWAVGP